MQGQEAAGHRALVVREQREVGYPSSVHFVFTVCCRPWDGAACVLGGSSVWAAGRGMGPPVTWEGLQCGLPAVGWCHLCPGRVFPSQVNLSDTPREASSL